MLGDPLTFSFLWYTLGPSVVPDSLAHHLDSFGFPSHLILCISTFTRVTCIRTGTLDVAATSVYSVRPYCDGYGSSGIFYVVWINKEEFSIVCPAVDPDYPICAWIACASRCFSHFCSSGLAVPFFTSRWTALHNRNEFSWTRLILVAADSAAFPS
jgi:hypothetical protein